MKIAIVHDYLNQFGGAERVISALHELYPQAPIYTSIYDATRLPEQFRLMDIRTSFMQKLPFVFPLFKLYFMLYPLAFESFDLSEYDVILSSSSAYAKGVKKRPGQVHICYCYTPARFIWRFADYLKKEDLPGWSKEILSFLLEPIKKWDLENSQRVDAFVAISQTVADRIKKIYGRESDIIIPPVETGQFRPVNVDKDYYLVVSRLANYKRVDLAIEAFRRLDLPLKVIGDGPARAKLERLAGANVEFLGRQSDAVVARYLAEGRALIFPGEEDFGIAPVEAMACGRPVIAFRAGGAVETIVEGESGLFFAPQTVEALIAAVKQFQFSVFDKAKIRQHALQYDKAIFQNKIEAYVSKKFREQKVS